MIDINNFKDMIEWIGFKPVDEKCLQYEKEFEEVDCKLKVDFSKKKLIYPEEKGFKINDTTTCNFEHPENFVVFECICRLFKKGYRPEHLELEKRWNLGHDSKGGKADICIYDSNGIDMLCIIECKTDGAEYTKELNNIKNDGGQLFSYWQQERSNKWLVLYASNFADGKTTYKTETINCSDDANILELAKSDNTIHVYKNAYTVKQLYEAWGETYEYLMCGDILFGEDTQAYNIGVKPLRKKDLKDFSYDDKIVNKFEEILRHNNVSDKENAFNRLIALFICKLVDETNKNDDDIVEFQYKSGTDTYELLQDRLQKLHQQGMDEFMEEKIFYVADDYAENLVKTYTGHKRTKMIEELKHTLRILKFYTNNDFAFKDVHNEELFYQNGKVLVEVVQLFEKYRIINSNSLQLLGDLFEQLLNKGFKQNEGQFFTPVPITRFIWDSLPLERVIEKEDGNNYPKIIDYACGAGHFLTEGYAAINSYLKSNGEEIDNLWVQNKLYGVEKDYRLARVSKISLFMHGAGGGNIIFGDGLENYKDKAIEENTFDILVANPPYSVTAFKPHLKLKNNGFELINKISNDGSEIETLFVERISQLLKPQGVSAVILPSSILNKENGSFVGARELILSNFYVRAIIQFGSKTFGATGTNTIALFIEKFNEPPKRRDMVSDSIDAIFENRNLDDWEDVDIIEGYLNRIKISKNEYQKIINQEEEYTKWRDNEYFKKYLEAFENSTEVKNKNKQKSFCTLTEDEKMVWHNRKFYEYVHEIEREKLSYYALVYNQVTLIVSAPENNKEQEEFLGYKWSNRKGSEGIQILNSGGILYSENNRRADDKIAYLVRESYNNKQINIDGLDKYYYYLNLEDMIDFTSVNFNKAIKTIKTRQKEAKEGRKIYELSDPIFEVSIGDRVIATELVDDGEIPVYSANVYETFGYINKMNITDFSRESILWGIDGDWMVNVIPEGKQFYPTDHCGVLRVKTDDIIPKYLAIALEVEGEFEKFSRSNRASIKRIKSLSIQVPDINEQQKIVSEIDCLDIEIMREEEKINMYQNEIDNKFIELFGNPINNPMNWSVEELNEVCDVRDGTHDSPKYIEHGYPLVTSKNIVNGKLDLSNANYISQEDYDNINKRSKVDIGDIIMPMIGTIGNPIIIIDEPDFAIKNVALIKFNKTSISNIYVQKLLSSELMEYVKEENQRGGTQKFLSLGDIRSLKIPIPPIELQNEFVEFVKMKQANKLECSNRIIELKAQRKVLIDKHFR